MPEKLRNRPGAAEFEQSVRRILAAKGQDIALMVRYGSMAKGTFDRHSDWDVLIGIWGPDERRPMDRYLDYAPLIACPLTPIVWTVDEVWTNLRNLGLTVLEAMKDGVVIVDHGPWAQMRAAWQDLMQRGLIRPAVHGWRLTEEAFAVIAQTAPRPPLDCARGESPAARGDPGLVEGPSDTASEV